VPTVPRIIIVFGAIFSISSCGGGGSGATGIVEPDSVVQSTSETTLITNGVGNPTTVEPAADFTGLEVWLAENMSTTIGFGGLTYTLDNTPFLLLPSGWATSSPELFFQLGEEQAIQDFPSVWVQWRRNGDAVEFFVGDSVFSGPDYLTKMNPGGADDWLNGCWGGRVHGFSGPGGEGGGVLVGSTSCFNADRTFTIGEAAGTYRIDGHQIQLTLSTGQQFTTMFGWTVLSNNIEIVVGAWYSGAL